LTLAAALHALAAPAASAPVEDIAAAPNAASVDDAATPERKLLLMLRLPAPHFRPDASYGGNYVDDGSRSARRRIAEELAQRHKLKLLNSWAMPALGLDCYVLEAAEGEPPERVSAQLARDPRVEWAQPMGVFHGLDGGADPLYPVQPSAHAWHLKELHQSATGRNVAVAVIDSGIEERHPDLQGQVLQAENFVDGSPYLGEAHGTAVGAIIAARSGNGGILGVAPDAHLLALRACWQPAGQAAACSSFTLAKALNFAILHQPKVINLSLGGPPDRLLERLLDVALARGISIVGALDPQGRTSFPASHPGVLAVGLQGSDAVPGALYAPGRDIPTAAPDGHWNFVTGTSYAAAHVTGMVALLSELRPSATPAQIRDALHPSDALNAGNIDACATLARIAATCTCSCAAISTLKTSAHP
jgi:subtilisin family serine protease